MNANPSPPAKATRLASEVARPLKLSNRALQLLTPSATPRQFFESLVSASLPDDAIRFLAAALPRREAIGWGLLCLKELIPKPLGAAGEKAIVAVEAWLKSPTETNRQAAGMAADAAGYDTAAGNLAAAVFWSGGSLTPPHLPPVPPRDDLTGTAVVGALMLASGIAASGPDPAKASCVALGAQVASGRLKVF